jgi:signal transduction histidine kinase
MDNMPKSLHFIRVYIVRFSQWLWRRRDLVMRSTLAWLLALIFSSINRQNDLDLRFSIRAPKAAKSPVSVINISRDEARIFRRLEVYKNLPPASSEAEVTAEFWNRIIGEVLKQKPTAIGITTQAEQALNLASENPLRWKNILHNKVVWSVRSEAMEKILSSNKPHPLSMNIGLEKLSADYDGFIRRYGPSMDGPNFAMRLLERVPYVSDDELRKLQNRERFINYVGPAGSITTVNLSDLFSVPQDLELTDKIVIIGLEAIDGAKLSSPVGPLNRSEMFANIIENSIQRKWVRSANFLTIALLLLAIVIASAWIMSIYPHAVALIGLLWLATLGTALSIYAFDIFYYLFPIIPIWIAIFSTYMTFLSLQVSLRDFANQQLAKEREFLLDVEELKNNFLSLISHDLKTPIAKLQGICDRILAKSQDQEITGDVTKLKEEVSDLYRYIRTILQVTRVESRDFRIHPEASDINEIVSAVCEQLSTLAQMKSVRIELELEPMFLVEVDPVLIHEVILNLVENAIKYSFENGRVTIRSSEVDDKVLVTVEDSGPGIPEAEQPRIFERFYRGEEGKRHSKGSGLGLYLVKYFVELHQGQIVLDSQPGKGTKIGFYLPISEKPKATELTKEQHVAELT